MAPLIPIRIKSPMSNSDEMSKSRRVVLGAVSDKCWVLGKPVDRELVDQGLAVIIDE